MARSGGDSPAAQAVQAAEDPDRLLEGEDPASRQADDVEHWVAVYQELVRFKEGLLHSARGGFEKATSKAARREIASTDLTILDAEHARLRRRLEFWLRRRRELADQG